MRRPLAPLFCIGAACVALFGFYATAAAPGAWWGDGQELAAAAWTLGVPHPTGYPLYMLLGHVWMKTLTGVIQGFDPGRALTLFSSLCVALGVALLIPLLRRAAALRTELTAAQTWGLAAGLAVMFGCTATLAEHATFSEVYPLTFVLIVALLLIAFRNEPEIQLQPVSQKSKSKQNDRPNTIISTPTCIRRAVALGLVFGLAALNHYSIAAWAPLVLFCLIRWGRAFGRPARIALACIFPAVVCLAGYIYLPLRARANPPLNWGDPSTFERLLWVLGGGQFTQIKVTAQGAPSRVLAWIVWWGQQWLPPTVPPFPCLLLGLIILAVASYGLRHLGRIRPELALGAAAAILFTALVAAFYAILDIQPYFLPAVPAVALGWAVALAQAAVRLRRVWLVWVPSAAALLLALGTHMRIDKSDDTTPHSSGGSV